MKILASAALASLPPSHTSISSPAQAPGIFCGPNSPSAAPRRWAIGRVFRGERQGLSPGSSHASHHIARDTPSPEVALLYDVSYYAMPVWLPSIHPPAAGRSVRS
jgi:hypothetical protein